MVPPPAPMEVTSAQGAARMKRATMGSVFMLIRPPVMRPTSKLVPPTSLVMMFLYPYTSPRYFPPRMPPAGPDMAVSTMRACAAGISPPWDSVA